MSPPIIDVQDLVKRYPGGQEPAVGGISFDVTPGEVLGFLGPNGAGKTTTLSILSTLLPPTSGRVTIGGHDIVQEAAAVRRIIGLVPQDLAVYPTLTARENLQFFGRIYGYGGADLGRRVTEALEVAGLADRARDQVDTFSGGMKRRLNIAAGLMHQPQVLFLDEPTVGVDPQSRNFIFDNVERLNQAGLTVLYTTHYMEEAERLCDRVAIIDSGRIIALGAPASLVAEQGGAALEVGLDREPADGLGAALAALPGVESWSISGQDVSLRTRQPDAALARLLQVAADHDVTIQRIQLDRPTLETVFLSLTGRQLREVAA